MPVAERVSDSKDHPNLHFAPQHTQQPVSSSLSAGPIFAADVLTMRTFFVISPGFLV